MEEFIQAILKLFAFVLPISCVCVCVYLLHQVKFQ